MRKSEAIERLLTLRQVPGLADAALTELATVERNVREQRFARGAIVARPGTRLSAIHLVVEGRLASSDGMQLWGPKQLFGAFEVIAGRVAATEIRAEVPTRTLQLSAHDYLELLEDNHGLLASARRLLARRLLATGHDGLPARPEIIDARGPGSLGVVERMFVLRRHAPLAHGRIQAVSALAQAADEVRFPAHARLVEDGDAVSHLIVVLDGALRTSRGVLAGGSIGALEILGEVVHDGPVDTLTPVHALRVPAAALFDVMEDHTDFALAIVAKLASEVLDAQHATRAEVEAN